MSHATVRMIAVGRLGKDGRFRLVVRDDIAKQLPPKLKRDILSLGRFLVGESG